MELTAPRQAVERRQIIDFPAVKADIAAAAAMSRTPLLQWDR